MRLFFINTFAKNILLNREPIRCVDIIIYTSISTFQFQYTKIDQLFVMFVVENASIVQITFIYNLYYRSCKTMSNLISDIPFQSLPATRQLLK